MLRAQILRPADGSELPLHDGLQLPVVYAQDSPVCRFLPQCFVRLFRMRLQAAVQMHIGGHLVPAHIEPCAVGTEDRIRGIFRVRRRVVARLGSEAVLIPARPVAARPQGKPSPSVGIGKQLRLIAVEFLCRGKARDPQGFPVSFRRGELTVHGMDIAEGAAELLGRQFQREGIPGLQQNAFRLHQALPDGAVCGLTEIAALRVLQVSAAGCKRDFDIRQR